MTMMVEWSSWLSRRRRQMQLFDTIPQGVDPRFVVFFTQQTEGRLQNDPQRRRIAPKTDTDTCSCGWRDQAMDSLLPAGKKNDAPAATATTKVRCNKGCSVPLGQQTRGLRTYRPNLLHF